MIRYEMEHKIKSYITSDIHKLEDYSDIEICNSSDKEDALKIMDIRIKNSTFEELELFCKAIDNNTVDYMTHGCR